MQSDFESYGNQTLPKILKTEALYALADADCGL